MEPASRYIPRLRTALVLTGTGTAGAYHAGVLRALQEAGVKIDLIAARGIGVVAAMFGAVDGGARLWDSGGLWRASRVRSFYGWRTTLRAALLMLAGAVAAVLVPFAALAVVLIVFAAGFLQDLLGFADGSLAEAAARWLDAMFAPAVLPIYVPRLVFVFLLGFLGALAVGAISTDIQSHARRRASGALWWRLFGAPLDASQAIAWFSGGLWRIMRGATRAGKPSPGDLGERYVEMLTENLGQPGFRELLLLAHDLDARRDIAFALLAEAPRREYLRARPDDDARPFETIDLTRTERRRVFDALASSLRLAVATEPHFMPFSPDSVWRGETHRLCDRPDAASRLLEEVAHAGAEQVILVSALPPAPGPHALGAGRRDVRGRLGESLAAIETAALRDAVSAQAGRFAALFEIRPRHNPLGPFDFAGCYDERSDRRQTLAELVDRGYEDAFRQFVDAVVAASGDWMSQAPAAGRTPRHRTGPVRSSISEQLAAHDVQTPLPGQRAGQPQVPRT